MSIIEKAAGKLGTDKPESRPVPPLLAEHPPEPPKNLIEEAVSHAADRVHAAHPHDSQASGWGAGSTVQCVSIDLSRLKAMGMVTPDAGRSQIAEEYRLIKRPLLARAFGHGGVQRVANGNLIMVTSSLPGEGKSFTAINLALSMAAEMENTVLLVDADVSKSAVLRYLGLRPTRGLIDVLRDPGIQLSDVLLKTDIEKLSILPAGPVYSHANELLASAAMKAFAQDIATRYPDRIVIFDSPPLLATTEASVLATHVGQIVFVVEAERTPQNAVTEALAHIASCEHIGLVLNKASTRIGTGDYYGYGYGYGYGQYGGSA